MTTEPENRDSRIDDVASDRIAEWRRLVPEIRTERGKLELDRLMLALEGADLHAGVAAQLGLLPLVFGLVEGFQWLPNDELVEVLARDDAGDRFIGGSVDAKAKTLTLLRGSLEVVVVPYSVFPKSGDGTAADFTRLRLTDYGRTIALGDYEAATDAILYELDPIYRRRLNNKRRQSERTFGASLTRLRKQRRLKRSDFAPISSKEIARIERNEIDKPHAKTLEAIASRLGVRSAEIEDY